MRVIRLQARHLSSLLQQDKTQSRNGGAALCPRRTQAMLQLAFMASEGAPPSKTIHLIETVLYGEPQVHTRLTAETSTHANLVRTLTPHRSRAATTACSMVPASSTRPQRRRA